MMEGSENESEWTTIAVQPEVVKVVSKLIENYEKYQQHISPTEFLETIFNTDKVADVSNNTLDTGSRDEFEKSNIYELSQISHIFSENENEGGLTKHFNSSVNSLSQCEYPEVCKATGSTLQDLKRTQRKYDKSVISVANENTNSIVSSEIRTDSVHCNCASDEDGSTRGIYTPSSSESSFTERAAYGRRKSVSDTLDYFSLDQEEKIMAAKNGRREKRERDARIPEKESSFSDQRFISNILPPENDTGLGQFQNSNANLENTKTDEDLINNNKLNDICSKFRKKDSNICLGFEKGTHDISTSMKGLRIDDGYRQTVANLFLKIQDLYEFINIVMSEFTSTNNHRLPSGFFKVMVYHLFFNLTTRNMEGIKSIIIHSYPVKLLAFLKFVISDQLRQSIKNLLKYYDQQFVQDHAQIHVKGNVMKKLHDEVQEFINKQNQIASKTEELENKKSKVLKNTQLHSSENKMLQEQDPKVFKTDFRARPIPQTTYEPPKYTFMKKEKPESSNDKSHSKKEKIEMVREKTNKSVRRDKLQDESNKEPEIDPFCSGCMEKEIHKSRRKQPDQGQQPENNPFVIDLDNMFPRPEPRRTVGFDFTSITGRNYTIAEEVPPQTQTNQMGSDDDHTNSRRNANQEPLWRAPQSSQPSREHTEFQDEVIWGRRSGKAAPKFKRVAIPVKQTASSVLREGARLKQDEMRTLEKLECLAAGGANWTALEELQQRAREEAAQEELEALERKHLQGLLTHEEALLARQQLLERQRVKADELRREKEILEMQLEEFRLAEEEKIKFLVDKIHVMELAAKEKCKEVQKQKNEEAHKFAREKKEQLAEMQRQRQDDLEQRIALIREVRALQGLTKMKKKEIDFTETAGYGLFYEMSIAELHERLNLLREEIREEIEQKRLRAQQLRAQQKEYIHQTQEYIKQQRMNKLIETNSKPQYIPPIRRAESEEVQMLRQKLNEVRKQRLGLI